jgi:hypothetical protein
MRSIISVMITVLPEPVGELSTTACGCLLAAPLDYKRFPVDTLNKGDLVEAYEAASWIVASLSLLEQAYGDYVRMVGEGDGSKTIRRQFLEHLAWFCSCLHSQVTSGDWEAIAAVDLELASVRISPARIGRRRKTFRPFPEIEHRASSMACLIAGIHRHAFGNIHNGNGGEFFNAALSAVPKELQKGGRDTSAFARAVARAWRGRKLREDELSNWEAGWVEVYEKLRISEDFQKAADEVGMDRILDFIRRELGEFRCAERIRAELKIEFAKAAKQRIAAGIPLESPKSQREKRSRPRTLSDEYNIKARSYLHSNRKRERTAEPVTVRELAEAVGCSEGKATMLPAWRALMEKRNERAKPKKPRAISLTNSVLATEGHEDEALKRLVEEHEADWEPSPLDEDMPDKALLVKTYKEV